MFFGVKALRAAFKADAGGAEDEMADAESAVKEVKSEAKKSTFGILLEVSTLIFLAEWGDRCVDR